MKIAVDAMGGDHGPSVIVEGAREAVRTSPGLAVLLVGDEGLLSRELKPEDKDRLIIRHASEVVTMDEAPSAALRRKKDSSIRVAADLVREGEAQAMVSAGNTGAVMATALFVLRPIPGVDRPGIATIMPSTKDPFVLIDAGANVDCKPLHLAQFAAMGRVYSRLVLGKENPRVGLLSIGEEAAKGNELTKETYRYLQEADLGFVGNVEGKDIYSGAADVVVCDGFTGNITLKVSEGLADALAALLRREIGSRFLGRLGYLFARPAFRAFKRKIDYSEYGGAPLLGISRVCIISHGRSSSKAIANAVRVAARSVREELTTVIGAEIHRVGERVSLA